MKNSSSKYLLILLIILGSCFADFYSKRWAESELKGKQTVTIIPGLLDFGFVENRGMVFGILNKTMPGAGKTILIVFRILILIALTVFIWNLRSRTLSFHLPFILIWAGAMGNLIDPFVYGYVVDFIHLRISTMLDWPFFFNLADAYITVSIAILFFQTLFSDIPSKKSTGSENSSAP